MLLWERLRGVQVWSVSGFGRSYFDIREAFNLEITLSEGEVEQETPKATGHRLGLHGRRWRIGRDHE